MMNRRKVLTAAIALPAAAAGAVYVHGERDRLSAMAAIMLTGAVPPPERSLVNGQFLRGETERHGDLLLARSEAAWLREHHGDVTDPDAILALLSLE